MEASRQLGYMHSEEGREEEKKTTTCHNRRKGRKHRKGAGPRIAYKLACSRRSTGRVAPQAWLPGTDRDTVGQRGVLRERRREREEKKPDGSRSVARGFHDEKIMKVVCGQR